MALFCQTNQHLQIAVNKSRPLSGNYRNAVKSTPQKRVFNDPLSRRIKTVLITWSSQIQPQNHFSRNKEVSIFSDRRIRRIHGQIYRQTLCVESSPEASDSISQKMGYPCFERIYSIIVCSLESSFKPLPSGPHLNKPRVREVGS